jgi:CDP-diacylglycerol--glycerol-3-phosphate 3-phosphatidyltransferase
LPGREHLRAVLQRYLEAPGVRFLQALGLTPNAVTILGFLVSVAAAGLVGAGFLLAGGIVFLAGSALDLMDGAMARRTGRVTRFGGLLDSVMDRLGEAALFLGLAVHVVREDLGEGRLLFLVVSIILALTASQAVSYLRARGEGLGIATRGGVMTRPERVVLLSLGLILGLRAVEVVLVVVAAVSLLTLLQRLYHIQRELHRHP